MKQSGQVSAQTAVCVRLRRPKDLAVLRGEGGCYEDYPGLGNRSIFYPYTSILSHSVGDTAVTAGEGVYEKIYKYDKLYWYLVPGIVLTASPMILGAYITML